MSAADDAGLLNSPLLLPALADLELALRGTDPHDPPANATTATANAFASPSSSPSSRAAAVVDSDGDDFEGGNTDDPNRFLKRRPLQLSEGGSSGAAEGPLTAESLKRTPRTR